MRKTDKKIEKTIVSVLTEVCEDALKIYSGFEWLTHVVNYQSYPDSLTIFCVFDTNDNLNKNIKNDSVNVIRESIANKLIVSGIKIKDLKRRIIFDTEEACEIEHSGNWKKRIEGSENARHV